MFSLVSFLLDGSLLSPLFELPLAELSISTGTAYSSWLSLYLVFVVLNLKNTFK